MIEGPGSCRSTVRLRWHVLGLILCLLTVLVDYCMLSIVAFLCDGLLWLVKERLLHEVGYRESYHDRVVVVVVVVVGGGGGGGSSTFQ